MATLGGSSDPQQYPDCSDLAIVCCHAICEEPSKPHLESSWRLQPFQRSDPSTGKPSEHETFIQHIQAAAAISHLHPDTLVIFSGGRTNSASQKSEGGSYASVLQHLQPSLSTGHTGDLHQSFSTEEYATDSYQNLLFSLLRFRQIIGRYPNSITVITHAFKEQRFLELHGPAIKWPAFRLRVQGINPPFTRAELDETCEGEFKRGYEAFKMDPYGVQEPLAAKRRARGWAPAINAIFATQNIEPEVMELLLWEGGENGMKIFPGRLPWEE